MFDSVLATEQPGAALEGSARAAYLDHDYAMAIELWGSAYEAYRHEGDGVGAIRVARTLAYMYLSVIGDRAVMQGWFARAVSLLADEGPCPETGWVSLNQGMFESDRATKERTTETPSLTLERRGTRRSSSPRSRISVRASSTTTASTKACCSSTKRLAAVAGRDVDDFTVVEEIFCQLFAACEYAHDVDRADQWIRVGEDIAARRNLPAVAAFCRTHYGGLLTAAGRWGEADAALSDAVQHLGSRPQLASSGRPRAPG